MVYIDGFLLVVPKKNVPAYVAMAKRAGEVWREHGALEYRECIGDDLATKVGIPFGKRAEAKRNETVAISWIVYKSRAHRDRVNKKVMADPRIVGMMEGKPPFDPQRMSWGGFDVVVDL